jgi:hypothetical protein
MNNDKHADGSLREAEPEQLSRPYPWCLACGFQHQQGIHCEGCNGDHSGGYCMTDELATDLARVGQLQRLVARASDRLFDQALRIVRAEGGE